MKLFGYEIMVRKAQQSNPPPVGLSSVYSPWMWGPIRESFSGAWQKNVTVDDTTSLLASGPIYTCVTGISSDIGKLRIKLCENKDGIWIEKNDGSPFLPVLRKPNHFQTHNEFIEHWIISKLLAGNTYVLKVRDQRGIVTALYVLNPLRVVPLVAEDSSVYYRLQPDYLSTVTDAIVVPASEIIHDRMCTLYHPLVGIPPLYACALSGTMATKIQSNTTSLFGNSARPGGVLTAPGRISDDTAGRLKRNFEENFSGVNMGRIFVAGEGLKFEPMTLTAEASQLIEQLKWTTEDIARPFHYPLWKLTGSLPAYSSGPDALTTIYYTDCLQPHIEKLESCLDEGLSLPSNYGTELDIDNLLRMDISALYKSNDDAVRGGWMKPNEARFRANLSKVDGGDEPYMQAQQIPLSILAKGASATVPAPTSPTTAIAPIPASPARDFTVEELEQAEATTRNLVVAMSV